MPKYTESKDVTDHLRKGYWPSYNVPYLDKIYEGLGYTVSKNEKGEKENIKYTKSPRAKIFDRDQGKINSIEEFKKFMRYNDYKNDKYSENDPSNAIAGRGDLKESYQSCHGAIDVKFISIKKLLEKKNIIHIISGPSNDQQPTFSWKNTTCESNPNKLSYKGQNEIWNFPWIDYNVQLFNNNNNDGTDTKGDEPNKDNDGNKSYIYWIIFGSLFVVVIAILIIVLICNKKKYGDVKKDINKISFKDDGVNENLNKEENLLS